MTVTVDVIDPAVCYERIEGITVRAACPRCDWRSPRRVAAGTPHWQHRLVADRAEHTCPNTGQETPS